MPGPVHWHEGLFLQPHHLQTMQHALMERIGSERRLGYLFAYGVVEMKLAADALENMLVRFDKLRVVMPSGLEVHFPDNADLPSIDIQRQFTDLSKGKGFTVSLAVPLWHAARANTVDITSGNTGSGGGADWKVKRIYKVAEVQRPDENTGENPQPMVVRQINARLIFDDDDHTDLETIPLLRIVHATGKDVGKAWQDPDYIPPCLVVGGSPTLRDKLRDLSNAVQASRGALVLQMNAGGFTVDTMRGVQFEQAMRLRTLNRFAARLGSLIGVLPLIRPYDFYLELRELLGELSSSHPERDKEFAVVEYDHDNLSASFFDLIEKIRKLLPGTVAGKYATIPFKEEAGVLVLDRPLSAEEFERPTDYFLGIKTREDHKALAALVEEKNTFKLMPRSIATKTIWGIPLEEERQPPLTLPHEDGLHYFRLLRGDNKMWDRVKDEKMMAIRWPNMQTSDFQISLYMTLP